MLVSTVNLYVENTLQECLLIMKERIIMIIVWQNLKEN